MNDLTILKMAANIMYPNFGVWLYNEWVRLNKLYFEGQIKVSGITALDLTPHGSFIADYSPSLNVITLHTNLLEPKGDAWDLCHKLDKKRYTSDILLHEMCHQYIHTILGVSTKDSHNCQEWVDCLNRISPMIGLNCKASIEKIRRKGIITFGATDEGCITRVQMSTWPHSVRPEDYYSKDRESKQKIAQHLLRRN